MQLCNGQALLKYLQYQWTDEVQTFMVGRGQVTADARQKIFQLSQTVLP